MRIIPTLLHGVIDYVSGILLIAAPWIFGYHQNGPETWGPMLIVIVMFVYDLLTDYEMGIIKLVAMPSHLWFDLTCGAAIISSPWLFKFSDVTHVPQFVFGGIIIMNALFSETLPSYAEKRQ
jgi:hypothetical protein